MTATTGTPATGAPDEEPEFADLCEQARDLAETGHFARAAQVYEQVLDGGSRAHRARAAMGLAVARHGEGKVRAAREAAHTAIGTGHPEFAPRAACHLALSYEEEGLGGEAERAWLRALDSGNERYAAAAHHGLARIAEERGDGEAARGHWEGALDGGADTVPEAARDYAERLLARGEPGRAEEVLRRGLDFGEDPELRLLLGAVHVERAIAEFGAVAGAAEPGGGGAAPAPPGAAATAVELLARLLLLRGDPDGAGRAWEQGLAHRDPEVAADVHGRLRRGFLEPDPDAAEAGAVPWWDPYLEAAAAEGSTPMLAGELFAALGEMHARAALPLAEGEARVAALRTALEEAVRVPGPYVWGRALHDDFRERLRLASGSREDVLPEGWPEHGERRAD
ncbi:tetratricopeptide repeat protein [Nocardiopsis sp. CNT-189]|uniref:tetratricopeptide repeat protein n=1 Tax=Nocardiopsis oceanisediminis TaxID=2816862 RepID=UPI003B38BB6B